MAADPVTATTTVAAQVAQAAHAVQQQAASLHAAAEVHAQKAHAATSQVQSLQATAQVIAKTHEELVKKIEDVKQTAVAQIQQPVVSSTGYDLSVRLCCIVIQMVFQMFFGFSIV